MSKNEKKRKLPPASLSRNFFFAPRGGPAASLVRYIGYYEIDATSNEALDEDEDFLTERRTPRGRSSGSSPKCERAVTSPG